MAKNETKNGAISREGDAVSCAMVVCNRWHLTAVISTVLLSQRLTALNGLFLPASFWCRTIVSPIFCQRGLEEAKPISPHLLRHTHFSLVILYKPICILVTGLFTPEFICKRYIKVLCDHREANKAHKNQVGYFLLCFQNKMP